MSEYEDEMSALRECVKNLVRREAVKTGSIPGARRALAARHRLTPGAFENAERGRTKRTDHKLILAVIEELQREWIRLEHELHMMRQIGADPLAIARAQSLVAQAKEAVSCPL